MEKKNIHRSLFAFLTLVSLVAFITVNIHAYKMDVSNGSCETEQFVQPKMENDTDKDIQLPGSSAASHIISLAQRLLSLSR